MTPIRDTHPAILQILNGIDQATVVGAHRRDVWERCWGESESPKYFSGTVRYHGALFAGNEKALFDDLRAKVFEKWLSSEKTVCEFGCGGGDNLAELNAAYGTEVIGFDWAASAVRRCMDRGILAQQFDMFSPPPSTFRGALLTIHALEQLGKRWRPFLDYVMRSNPSICVHIEPIEELYDETNLLDYLALKYHAKRGYLSGFLTHLVDDRGIEVLHVERSKFGNLFHEAYSCVVWRPL